MNNRDKLAKLVAEQIATNEASNETLRRLLDDLGSEHYAAEKDVFDLATEVYQEVNNRSKSSIANDLFLLVKRAARSLTP